jgi:hypothetical protein
VSLLGLVPRAGAQEPPTEWTLSLGAQESNEFSRVFDGVEQEDLILDNVNAQLGVQTRTQRSHLGFFGRVGYDFYRQSDYQDRFTFGGGLAWDYQGQRFGSGLSLSIERNLTAQTLSSLGVLAPGLRTDTINAGWAFNYQKSSRTALYTSLSYDNVKLESDRGIPGSSIVLPQSPFRDAFEPLLGAPDPPTDPDTIELPDPEESILDILATEGFSSPTTHSQWANVGFGVNHRATEHTTWGFDVGGGYRTIDDRIVDLRQGSEGGFRFWTQRTVGQGSLVSASYDFQRTLVLEPAQTIQSLVAGYSYSWPGRDLFLRLSGGASYFQAQPLGDLLTPTVDVLFSAGLSRSTHFSAAYQRQFSQSLGFANTLLIDYGSLSLLQRFGTKVDVTLLVGGSFATNPLIVDSRYDAIQAGGALSFRIVESLQVGTSFYVLETEQSDVIPTEIVETRRKMWTASITYTTSWR